MLDVFNTILVKNEVRKEHVINFLKDNVSEYGVYYDKNKDEFSYSEYWDYRDQLSDSTLKTLLENYSNEKGKYPFITIVYDYFIDNHWFTYVDEIYKIKNDFMEECVKQEIEKGRLKTLHSGFQTTFVCMNLYQQEGLAAEVFML